MAGTTPNYYKTLGVSRSATQDEIKKAFRKLAQTHHPDAGGDENKFKEINEAYEVLGDEKKRKVYDQYGSVGHAGGMPGYGGAYGGYGTPNVNVGGVNMGDFGDIFGGFTNWQDILESIRKGEGAFGSNWDFNFGGGAGAGKRGAAATPRPTKGKDSTATLNITFEEAFTGCEKNISVRTPGKPDATRITVPIPAGAVEGARVRIKSKGGEGTNGGDAGDLLITLKIQPHDYFSRSGSDVVIEVPVTVDEAALGAAVIVPAPDGSRLRVKVPAGSQEGAVITIPDKGAPKVKAAGTGNLVITVHVVVPKTLTEAQRDALQAYRAASAEATEKSVRPWQ